MLLKTTEEHNICNLGFSGPIVSYVHCVESTLTLRAYLRQKNVSIQKIGLIMKKICELLVQLDQLNVYPVLSDDNIYLMYDEKVSIDARTGLSANIMN